MTEASQGDNWAPPSPDDRVASAPPQPWGQGAPPLMDQPASLPLAPPLAAPPGPPAAGAPHVPPPPGAPGQPALTFRSWQPGIVALRPLPFGEFLTVPFKAMRYARSAVIGGPLIAFTITALVAAGAVWLAFTDDELKLFSLDNSFGGVSTETVVVGIAAVVLAVLSDLLAVGVIYPAVLRAAMGQRLTFAEAFKEARPRLGHLFLLSLVVGAAGFALFALAYLPMLGMFSSDADTVFMATQFGNLTTNAASIAWTLFATPIIVVARGVVIMERSGPIAALRRTFALIKGRYWWSVLISLVVSVIAAFLVYAFLFLVILLGVVGFMLATSQEIVGVIIVVIAVLLYIASVVIVQYSFFGAVGALIYLDLRMRKEGLGMELARAAEAAHQSRSYTIA